jgi:glycosyltransferase involved in cell wall biosynthesis
MISVITPVYNGEKFIAACIQNVIDQNCSNVEHIIVDGGSSDRTLEIVQHYAAQYSHIRWISEKDQGQSDAMNKGIKLSEGGVIGILNVDDYYEPNVLNQVSDQFKTLPEPTFLTGNCNVLNEEDQILYVNRPHKITIINLLADKIPHPYNPSAYFYHKSLHKQIGDYDINEHYAMDLDFILKAVRHANVKYVDQTWGNFREIQGTKTNSAKSDGTHDQRRKDLLKKHCSQLSWVRQVQVAIESNIFYKETAQVLRTTRDSLLK